MHPPVREFVKRHLPKSYQTVIEVGSLNINGGIRDLLDPNAKYLGIDEQPGPGVGLVGDFCDFDWTEPSALNERFQIMPFDLVLCCEVLEHTPKWREIVAHAAEVLSPGGTFLMTCATTGRNPHSARGTGPIQPGEYYRNVTRDELAAELAKHFEVFQTEVAGADLRAWARTAGELNGEAA